ncbi:efflux RND transporter periplasmic adaptor subunit [bacterium]|nr:efflux RND transporter periplasmic adaptor subunit [bacterium]
MKIDWKSKQTRAVVILLAVILIPIIYNQAKSLIYAAISSYMMSQPKTVEVANPVSKDIYYTLSTTGRIEAQKSVDVIARVSGWLQERYFQEGDKVKKGQKLFLIEPDEYVFAAKTAKASVNENTAVYNNSEIDLKRAEELLKEDLVSREYYDNALTERNKSRAALDGSISELNRANLNLSYTNITSPMEGRIGKANYSVGNYVTPSSGVIAEIYTTNPMKVIFPLKSGDFVELKKYFKEKKDESPSLDNTVSILLTLSDGSKYEEEGVIEFVDNKVDETTGTVTMRAVFENPDELLVPGDYVNVTIRINKPYKVMLIPQSATKTDVGTGYYVWTVKDGKAVKKDIVVNENYDNNWIVESGLSYDDVVVMKGIQDVYKSGQPLNTKPYQAESLTQQNDGEAK